MGYFSGIFFHCKYLLYIIVSEEQKKVITRDILNQREAKQIEKYKLLFGPSLKKPVFTNPT
jgi:hypothetical protein